jgi:hypothetical protein
MRRTPLPLRRPLGPVGIALLVFALAGAGCSGREDSDDATMAASSGDDSTDMTVAAALYDSDEATASGSAGGTGGVASADVGGLDFATKVVRTADLRIEVEKGAFGQQLRNASMLARSLGGFVESSSTSSFEEGDASGEITLRVPVERFDDAMEQIAKLGTIESSSEQGEDVTDQLVDLDARVRALRAEEDALNALMAEAANVNDVLAVRSTAIGIRQEIERLAAQQKSLADRSSFSTIHLVLHESNASLEEESPGDDDWSIAEAFDTAAGALVAVVGAMIVVVGDALPLVPFALVAYYVMRRRRVVTEG